MCQVAVARGSSGKEDIDRIIASHLEIPKPSFSRHREAKLEELGLDSIAAVQLAEELFSIFQFEIHPDELFKATPGVLATYIPVTSIPTVRWSSAASIVRAIPEKSGRAERKFDLGRKAGAVEPAGEPHAAERNATVATGLMGSTSSLSWQPEEVISKATWIPESSPGSFPEHGIDSLHILELEATAAIIDGRPTGPSPFENPLGALTQSDSVYEEAARRSGFAAYWDTVGSLQKDMVIAFINEALINLGIDLAEYPHGVDIPPIPHIPKYGRLIQRLWDILESQYIVIQRGGKVLRGSDRVPAHHSAFLCRKLRAEYPEYECEAELLEIIGPVLADCLTGNADPIQVLFGSAQSREMMQKFYCHSPMMVAHMQQLGSFFTNLVLSSAKMSPSPILFSGPAPIRILEVGAGTGGTTGPLVEALTVAGVSFHYTFTDIGLSFVSKAKSRRKNTPCMEFSVYDIEQDIPKEYRGQFDIVFGANVVHATSDRIATCRRLREALCPGGILVLSEVTHPIDWYDICFGLLDGWWLADKGKGYAVQPASVWMDVFDQAGFTSMAHSGGLTEEANTQQILVACTK